MTKRISKGTCALCQGEFSRASMTKHLEACQRRAADAARAAGRRPGRTMKHFHVVVEGRELPLYWMHLEVRTGITLAELDAFLRETWLECCGHMSAFEIGGQRYVSGAGLYFEPAPSEHSLRVRLDRVFYPGLSSLYEYDFGTTTELRLKVVAEETREARCVPCASTRRQAGSVPHAPRRTSAGKRCSYRSSIPHVSGCVRMGLGMSAEGQSKQAHFFRG